jgi:hypothetical protein
MPDTLPLPPGRPRRGGRTGATCVRLGPRRPGRGLAGHGQRPHPHQTAVRVVKVVEETGEAMAAYIGLAGANPRKDIPGA